MEKDELLRRLSDLRAQCEKSSSVKVSCFLTPAERYEAERMPAPSGDSSMYFFGGLPDSERCICAFLPYYMEPEMLEPGEYISCLRFTAHFGEPGHRDYLGALLNMGVGRERIGDIIIQGSTAYVICMNTVLSHLQTLDRVGRCGVTVETVPLADIPTPERKVKHVSFSVMSMRLDAIVAGMFNLSRTEAARQIAAGNVSLNYSPCEKPDVKVTEGDVISLRHAGKGTVGAEGGTSRKGRLFVSAEILL